MLRHRAFWLMSKLVIFFDTEKKQEKFIFLTEKNAARFWRLILHQTISNLHLFFTRHRRCRHSAMLDENVRAGQILIKTNVPRHRTPAFTAM